MIYKIDSRSLLGKMVPNAYVQKVVLKNNTISSIDKNKSDPNELSVSQKKPASETICELTLGLKDITNDRLKNGAWSNNRKLYSQYRVGVVRSLDPAITEEFLSFPSPRSHQILVRASELASSGRVTIGHLSLAGLTYAQLAANSFSTTAADGSGSSIKDVVLTYTDSELPETLRHLTYFIFLYPKLLTAGQSLGARSRELVGMCHVEKVIENASVLRKLSLYTHGDNPSMVWAGPVHRMPNGQYHTGATHTSESKILKRVTVDNKKVQDQRALKHALNGNISLLSPPPHGVDSDVYSAVTSKDAIFTDFLTAQDRGNRIRFLFGVNLRTLAIRYTKFGDSLSRIAGRSNAASRYLDAISIERIVIKRRRVDPENEFNRLSSPINGESKFDKEQIEDVISQFSPSSRFVGSGPSLSLIDIHTENNGEIVYYSGIDDKLRNVNYGKYQYAVELDVTDRTEESINTMIFNLRSAKKILDSYVLMGSKRENYNPRVDRFRSAYLQKTKSGPWISAIQRCVEIMEVVSVMSKSTIQSLTVENLTPFVHSSTANPDSVRQVIKLIDSSMSVLMSLVDPKSNNATKDDAALAKDRTSRASGRGLKLEKIVHYFEKEFDSSFSKDVGYDYLVSDDSESNTQGLFSIEESAFFDRIEKETNKYFVSPSVPIDLSDDKKPYTQQDSLTSNDATYLSPAMAKVFDSTYRLSEVISPDKEQYRDLEKVALSYNVSKELTGAPSTDVEAPVEDLYSIQTLNTMQANSYKSFFQTPEENDKEKDPVIAPSVKEPPYGSAGVTESKNVELSQGLDGALRYEMLLKIIGDPSIGTALIDKFNLKKSSNKIFSDPDVAAREKKLKSLPNQIKSVLLGNNSVGATNMNWFLDENSDLTDSILGAIFRLNFYALNKIEVLTRFDVSSQSRHLARRPIFMPLTRQIIATAPAGSSLLCRLVPYTDTDFALNGLPNSLKLPIYNEYFVIRRSAQVEETTATQPRTIAAATPLGSPSPDNTLEMLQYAHSSPPPATIAEPRRRTTRTSAQNLAMTSAAVQNRRGY